MLDVLFRSCPDLFQKILQAIDVLSFCLSQACHSLQAPGSRNAASLQENILLIAPIPETRQWPDFFSFTANAFSISLIIHPFHLTLPQLKQWDSCF
jgi:hypothetical protein